MYQGLVQGIVLYVFLVVVWVEKVGVMVCCVVVYVDFVVVVVSDLGLGQVVVGVVVVVNGYFVGVVQGIGIEYQFVMCIVFVVFGQVFFVVVEVILFLIVISSVCVVVVVQLCFIG